MTAFVFYSSNDNSTTFILDVVISVFSTDILIPFSVDTSTVTSNPYSSQAFTIEPEQKELL